MNKLFLVAALSLAFVGCKKSEAPEPSASLSVERTWQVKGVVRGFQGEDGQAILIEHEAIPGLMEAMTMGFEVSDRKLSKSVKKGDKIVFTLWNKGDEYKLTALEKQK